MNRKNEILMVARGRKNCESLKSIVREMIGHRFGTFRITETKIDTFRKRGRWFGNANITFSDDSLIDRKSSHQ